MGARQSDLNVSTENEYLDTLYEDEYIRLSNGGVQLKTYYFPLGGWKYIAWDELEAFNYERINMLTSKGWGQGCSNVWWACDVLRQFSWNQARFLSFSVKGEGMRKGFSAMVSSSSPLPSPPSPSLLPSFPIHSSFHPLTGSPH